jgi:hypothetical protein
MANNECRSGEELSVFARHAVLRMKLTSKVVFFLLVLSICSACVNGAGTLGGFKPITFPVSKEKLEEAIDTLFAAHTEYSIPEKWEHLDSWDDRGYGFLQSHIFYFKGPPEEMFYVTFIGDEKMLADPTRIQIAIRAVNRGKNKWLLSDDLSESERGKIVNRFHNEIVSKLEYYLHVRSY